MTNERASPRKRKVLFLCTGNSARSQMAEALVNHRLGDTWESVSAGTRPTGTVHPAAVRVLAELGIEHHGRSKSVDGFRDAELDLVVTVCDFAAEDCPVWLGKGRHEHLGFPDPTKAVGSDDDVMVAFRRVRDDIAAGVFPLLTEFERGE